MVCKASLTHVSHTCLPECPAPGGQSPLPPSYHLSQVLCRGLWKPSATMLQYSSAVCVCVSACVCVCLRVHSFARVCAHVLTRMCVDMCESVCVHACMQACS